MTTFFPKDLTFSAAYAGFFYTHHQEMAAKEETPCHSYIVHKGISLLEAVPGIGILFAMIEVVVAKALTQYCSHSPLAEETIKPEETIPELPPLAHLGSLGPSEPSSLLNSGKVLAALDSQENPSPSQERVLQVINKSLSLDPVNDLICDPKSLQHPIVWLTATKARIESGDIDLSEPLTIPIPINAEQYQNYALHLSQLLAIIPKELKISFEIQNSTPQIIHLLRTFIDSPSFVLENCLFTFRFPQIKTLQLLPRNLHMNIVTHVASIGIPSELLTFTNLQHVILKITAPEQDVKEITAKIANIKCSHIAVS